MCPTVNTNRILDPNPPRPPDPIAHRSEYESATGDESIGVSFGEGHGLLKLMILLVAVIGGLVLGFGFLFRSGDRPMNDPSTKALADHTQVMREAVQMAREAQELNRQRMREMERAMMGETEGELAAVESADAPAPQGDQDR